MHAPRAAGSAAAAAHAVRAPTAVSPEELARIEEIDRITTGDVDDAVRALIARMGDPAWTVRRAVVAALAALGEPAVGPLCQALRADRSSETRVAAVVDALSASTGDVETAASRLARDPNPAVVADAANILGRRRFFIAVPTLIWLTEQDDDNIAVAAIEALGRVGGRSAVDALVAAVESGRFFRAFPAIDVLGRSGDPRAVAPLARLLDKPQYTFEAARSLGRTGDRGAVAPLARLLTSPVDANVRVAALSLSELQARHRVLYGDARSLDDTLRAHTLVAGGVRRLAQCVQDAGPAETVAICDVIGSLQDDDAVPTLTRLLASTAEGVAAAAGRALKRLGKSGEHDLAKALAASSDQRLTLLPLITRASSAVDVIACFADPNPMVRALACDAVARLGNPIAVKPLFALLEDENPRVAQAALGALQSLGTEESRSLAFAAASSPSHVMRRAALRILSYFGDIRTLPAFVAGVADDDARVRDAAIQGLPFLEGREPFEVLLACAVSPDDKTRTSAMRALGHCAGDDRAVAYLLRGLADAQPWIRYYACQSLGKIGAEVASAAIAKALDDDAGQVRVAAVEALSHLQSPAAAAALKAAARSADPDVQRAALIGLGFAHRPDTLNVVVDAARSDDAATRLVALSALAAFSSSQVLPILARAVSDSDPAVQSAAVELLAAYPGVEATRILASFLDDEDGDRIVSALSLHVEGRVPGILAMLEHADDDRAPRLTAVLARLGRSDGEAALVEACSYPNAAARKAAAAALAALGTAEGVAVVRRLAEHDPSSDVRRVCALLSSR